MRGLRELAKRLKIFRYIKSLNFDLICLQETHSVEQDEVLWSTQWGSKIIFSHGESNARGVSILISKKAPIKIKESISDEQGRFINLICEIENHTYQVINIYAPNNDTPSFFEALNRKLVDCEVEKKLVLGDFNLTLESIDVSTGLQHKNVNAHDVLIRVMDQNDLCDIWRKLNPDDIKFTWERVNPDVYMARLDFILTSEKAISEVLHAGHDDKFKSDHDIPYITIQPMKLTRGPGFWRFNNTLLLDKNYVEEVNKIIHREKTVEHDSMTKEMGEYQVKY